MVIIVVDQSSQQQQQQQQMNGNSDAVMPNLKSDSKIESSRNGEEQDDGETLNADDCEDDEGESTPDFRNE